MWDTRRSKRRAPVVRLSASTRQPLEPPGDTDDRNDDDPGAADGTAHRRAALDPPPREPGSLVGAPRPPATGRRRMPGPLVEADRAAHRRLHLPRLLGAAADLLSSCPDSTKPP